MRKSSTRDTIDEEELHEGPSQGNGGLNQTNSNSTYQENIYTSQSYPYFGSGTSTTSSSRFASLLVECVVAPDVQASRTSVDGYPVFDYRAIQSNLLEVNDLPPQERDSVACHCQRAGGMAVCRTTSQDQLISILDDALCIIDEALKELSHQ